MDNFKNHNFILIIPEICNSVAKIADYKIYNQILHLYSENKYYLCKNCNVYISEDEDSFYYYLNWKNDDLHDWIFYINTSKILSCEEQIIKNIIQ